MFVEIPEEKKARALKDLATYFWPYAAAIGDVGEEEKGSGWFITVFSPEFVSQLERSAGADAQTLQQLLAGCMFMFTNCILRSIELASVGEPLRLDSLREFLSALQAIHNLISKEERDYRQSLKAERGEQSFPDFLSREGSSLSDLLGGYIEKIVEEMGIPSSKYVEELIAECDPDEVGKLTEGIQRLAKVAIENLADQSLPVEDLYLNLLLELEQILKPEL